MKAGFLLGNNEKKKNKERAPRGTHPGLDWLPPRPGSSFLSVEERCRRRLAKKCAEDRYARENRVLSLGEQVIRCPLIRDGILRHFNPRHRRELGYVLELRCFYGVLPDIDLKECYFKGVPEDEFLIPDWRTRPVADLRQELVQKRGGVPRDSSAYVARLEKMETKDEIVAAHRPLLFIPWRFWLSTIHGGFVLRTMNKGNTVEELTEHFNAYFTTLGPAGSQLQALEIMLKFACIAGLDESVIIRLCSLLRKCCGRADAARVSQAINEAPGLAALSGHIELIDVLHREFGAVISDYCLLKAVGGGQNAVIDHLVAKYGVGMDPNAIVRWEGDDTTALVWAVGHGRVHTVRHLIDVHGANMHVGCPNEASPVEWAAITGQVEVLDVFFGEYGASSYRVDCFMHAARAGQVKVIDHLVAKYGVDPDVVDGDGYTALHWAAYLGVGCVVQHLLHVHHVDAEKKVVEKFTALDFALYGERGWTGPTDLCVVLLRNYMAKKRGSTPEKVKSMFDDMNPDDLTNAMRRM